MTRLITILPTIFRSSRSPTYSFSTTIRFSSTKFSSSTTRSSTSPQNLNQLEQGLHYKLINKWTCKEINILLDYIKENYSAWSEGNKTSFYDDIAKNVLPKKGGMSIKSKISGLIKNYILIKEAISKKTGIIEKEAFEKLKNNVEVITIKMNQLQERILEKKLLLEKEQLEVEKKRNLFGNSIKVKIQYTQFTF
ncbi:1763_t:CDS:2 [Rhizophagus irregularis]|nr:1763_t:CDS:2 [Rhizophagus irregularis]